MTTTPTELPEAIVPEAHALATQLAIVAGDEAAVMANLTRAAGADPDRAAALCVATLVYTFARCVTPANPSTTNTKEKSA